jgi:hypothetical protein
MWMRWPCAIEVHVFLSDSIFESGNEPDPPRRKTVASTVNIDASCSSKRDKPRQKAVASVRTFDTASESDSLKRHS